MVERGPQALLEDALLGLGPLSLLLTGVQRLELRAGHIEADHPQLVVQLGVGTGRRRLAFERPDLAFDFSDQVEQPFQVLLGGGQPPFGPLTPAAVLENARRLLDDRPAVFGMRLQNGVEVALADDDVLLAADTGVRQELLDIEQPAGGAVHGVLAVARAEESPGDGDFGQIGGQLAGAVVDGQGHFGPAQSGAAGGAGEDDVLHLRRAHRAGTLGSEDPRHGVDHVRLPAPVRAHHHGDARLEFEHGRVGEGFETLEGERLQEHRALTLSAVGAARVEMPTRLASVAVGKGAGSDLAMITEESRPTP